MSTYKACIEKWNTVAKPPGSLGELETLIAKIAMIQGTADIDISKKAALVFCADNGVAAQGVTSHGSEVTAALTRLHREGKSTVAVMAKAANADVYVYELGMTADMTLRPAMTREQTQTAIDIGRKAVLENPGYKLFSVGETGMGNTTTAAAVASVLLNVPVATVTGRGAGLDDEGLARKRAAIEKAIKVNQPVASDAFDVLSKVGGFDIAAMCGAYLAGAERGAAMVIDGVISAVAALAAIQMNPKVIDYVLPSHMSAEPAARLVFDALGLNPIIRADMRLGEGTGAVALFPLLDMALAVLTQAARFADL